MNVENIQTATDFAQTWTTTPEDRRVSEVISVYRETHRLTDPWSSYLDAGGMYVLDGKEKTYVKTALERTSYLGNLEGQVFDSLEYWAKENDEGTAVWISPSYPNKYPCSKIIFHQISYEAGSLKKVILNTAILFDSSPEDCLNLVHQLFPNLKDQITTTCQLRQALIIPDDTFQISSLIPETKPPLDPEELIVRAREISVLIGRGVNPDRIAREMQRQGLLGEHSISCPSASKMTFSELITSHSRNPGEIGPTVYCATCKSEVKTYIKEGIIYCALCGQPVGKIAKDEKEKK